MRDGRPTELRIARQILLRPTEQQAGGFDLLAGDRHLGFLDLTAGPASVLTRLSGGHARYTVLPSSLSAASLTRNPRSSSPSKRDAGNRVLISPSVRTKSLPSWVRRETRGA